MDKDEQIATTMNKYQHIWTNINHCEQYQQTANINKYKRLSTNMNKYQQRITKNKYQQASTNIDKH